VLAVVHLPAFREGGLSARRRAALVATEGEALRRAARVMTTSGAAADDVSEAFGIPRSAIAVAPPGTAPAPRADRADPGRLLCAASLTSRKGHDTLLDALSRMADLNWRLRVAGAGDPRPLIARAARAGIADRVDWLGELGAAEMAAEYAAAGAFVLASRFETYGMALAEALARGLPVVSTTAGAIPDTVPASAGALVPPGDPAALARALRRLVGEPLWAAAAADASWRAGRDLPRWSHTAASVRAVLEAL
jgi:glycosyltransferase involved in cell wall biosynthesis